ncbi:MAG: ATP-binding protein [Lautropia sp.]|nr:ATP-binding protein [Lautropia sp.]
MKMPIIDIRMKTTAKRATVAAALTALFLAGTAHASGLTNPLDSNHQGRVSVTGVALPGETVKINGSRFKPGQQVRLLRDGYSITTQEAFDIGEDGTFSGEVVIPPAAVVGRQPVVVQVKNPDWASIFEFKVSPRIPLLAPEKIDVAKAPLEPGLYQAVYSKRQNAVYVTSSVGRPPTRVSKLMKVDPVSLQITKSITPPTDDNGRQLHGVYGIAIDDYNDNIWVGNTRTGGIAVYKSTDLSLVKQFPNNTVRHSRDLAVYGNRVYVSEVGTSIVHVFDTNTLQQTGKIVLEPSRNSEEYPTAYGFALDKSKGKIYVVSNNETIYVIDEPTQKVEKTIPLPGSENSTAVAVAPDEQLLFVVSQGTDNVLIVDIATGKVKHDVKVGAGPLSVVWDQANRVAWVASRASDSIAVVGADGKLVANIPGASFPNHLATDGEGTVFAVNKARGTDDPNGDHIRRLFLNK